MAPIVLWRSTDLVIHRLLVRCMTPRLNIGVTARPMARPPAIGRSSITGPGPQNSLCGIRSWPTVVHRLVLQQLMSPMPDMNLLSPMCVPVNATPLLFAAAVPFGRRFLMIWLLAVQLCTEILQLPNRLLAPEGG